MGIQDFALEVATDLDLTGVGLPFTTSPAAQAINLGGLLDRAAGTPLTMEFEVTEDFTTTGGPTSSKIPFLLFGPLLSDISLTIIQSPAALCGYNIIGGSELGLQTTDVGPVSVGGYPNLFEGDKIYVPIPTATPGSPWSGDIGDPRTRQDFVMPARTHMGAIFWQPTRLGWTELSWSAATFATGKISARVVIGQPLHDPHIGQFPAGTGMRV